MTVKDSLISLLEENRGSYVSGAVAAQQLGCSRGAVWKAVKALEAEGYNISAVTNKGYRLEENSDVISQAGIERYLSDDCTARLKVYSKVESTNTLIRTLANEGAQEGVTAVSGEQTKGRGRLGRSFYSPSDTGLYLSILLRPEMSAADAVKITTAAAVAVAESVEEVSGESTDIKWVNDVYMNDRKICGILTEAQFSIENGGLEYAVVGIGINVYEPKGGFPNEIKDIAGAALKAPAAHARNRIAAGVISRFMRYYRELDKDTFLEGYRKRLMWKNERINIITPVSTTPALMLDVDGSCRLRVRLEDSSEKLISSGEISIRKEK
ncbi:MAG: biotin--[Ruminococcus sp.]|nr:biotin--[acetyl-CoA-carboxylase] ligase [Ruminococcus sp.]